MGFPCRRGHADQRPSMLSSFGRAQSAFGDGEDQWLELGRSAVRSLIAVVATAIGKGSRWSRPARTVMDGNGK